LGKDRVAGAAFSIYVTWRGPINLPINAPSRERGDLVSHLTDGHMSTLFSEVFKGAGAIPSPMCRMLARVG